MIRDPTLILLVAGGSAIIASLLPVGKVLQQFHHVIFAKIFIFSSFVKKYWRKKKIVKT
jgi:hypothetical protein